MIEKCVNELVDGDLISINDKNFSVVVSSIQNQDIIVFDFSDLQIKQLSRNLTIPFKTEKLGFKKFSILSSVKFKELIPGIIINHRKTPWLIITKTDFSATIFSLKDYTLDYIFSLDFENKLFEALNVTIFGKN
jgi:hypothetical protein